MGEKAVDRRYPPGHVIAPKEMSTGDRACLTIADAEAERSEIVSRSPHSPVMGVFSLDIGT